MTDELTGDRQEWTESEPKGVRYRVVVAPRGTRLRASSTSYDLESVFLELVGSMVMALVPRGRAFKLGVLREDQGRERFVLKERLVSEAEAVAKAREIRDCLRRGDLRFAGR